jgi:spermidine synthase
MSGHVLVDRARVPDGVELQLLRSGGDFLIAIGDNELMSTDIHASEQSLATLTCARLGARTAPQLLIGGYGMGFTLRAALEVLGPDAQIVVAEIMPEIIAWARGPMRQFTGNCLDDPRVQLVIDDVAMLIHAASDAYDAILLDVDNGPEGLTRRWNDGLYSLGGLAAARRALRPGGLLAIWSADGDDAFTRQLQAAGFQVSEEAVDAVGQPDGSSHHIWFAANP